MNANRTYIIAEAGVNHNGSIQIAKKLIDVAAESGADAIKFQTFKADKLVSKIAPKAEYQMQTTDVNETQYNMLKKLELTDSMHEEIFQYCKFKKIEFLSTPFDAESLNLLVNKFQLRTIKVPSGEITNGPFLLQISRMQRPMIISTGMSTLSDVEKALSVIAYGLINEHHDYPSQNDIIQAYSSESGQKALKNNVTLLHCTTEYPAPFHEVNLQAMKTLKAAFGLPIGFSDHTPGTSIPVAAVALGATVIEKHFTLDKEMEGPDHKASLNPDELKYMIQSIREVEAALGSPQKRPTSSELKNKDVARKSIVASKEIREGEVFTSENLAIKRPGNGISPMEYWSLLGKKATKKYAQDDLII